MALAVLVLPLLLALLAGSAHAVEMDDIKNMSLEEFLQSVKTFEAPKATGDFYYGYDADDLALMNNFILQHYPITTEDGYELDLWRLNDSIDPLFDDELAERTPILIAHGLTCDGTIFMNNQRDNSLAYLLYDAGYDIWIANFRGNYYSRGHTVYNSDTDQDYWYFTAHEQARYDIITTIDFVLKNNNHPNVTLLGHSMGSEIILVLLSMYEEFGFDPSKVKSVILTAPAVISEHMTAMMFEDFHKMKDGEPEKILFKIFGTKSLVPHEKFGYILSRAAYAVPQFTYDFVEWSCGPDETDAYKGEDLYYYVNYYPSGGSIYTLAHYFQLIQRGGFSAYDYSGVDAKLNMARYGSDVPPVYDLNKVPTNIPIYIMPGANDTMGDKEDVTELYNILNQKERAYLELFSVEGYNHIDFMWANNIDKYVYPNIQDFLNKYAQDN